jgi:hypothetical protein
MRKKRLLMIAFEFPPCNGASIQRILSVYRGFIAAGWSVDVLTATESAHLNLAHFPDNLLPNNPDGQIIRTTAIDIIRSTSIKGKHIGALAVPDRWGGTWIPSSILSGIKLTRKTPPDIIWSSSPIPSTHLIARALSSITGAKWIADYRDPMPYFHNGKANFLNAVHKKIDKTVQGNAAACVFATQETLLSYAYAFPHAAQNYHLMENGYDAELLAQTKINIKLNESNKSSNQITMLYAGVLYPEGRDPLPLLEAISKYHQEHGATFTLRFQGAGDGLWLQESINSLGLGSCVEFTPSVPFTLALENILTADMLLLIQDKKFNTQVPGKLYEYLASERPILLISPIDSATTKVANTMPEGVFFCHQKEHIYKHLCDIVSLRNIQSKTKQHHKLPSYSRDTLKHSREKGVAQLISLAGDL